MTVICETAGCENEGIAIEIADTWSDLEGNSHPVEVVQCGACFEWIIAPVEPPALEQTEEDTMSEISEQEPS
ncbi:hypothetical protein [Microbacterium sp. K24]|uniref:hypothetical protein n=1 Tax=Microbacterium sp. K24 TaxID=2305446 RepID=UPI00109CFC98|nr:hypothetical protein [Microbacterium sp. K24]